MISKISGNRKASYKYFEPDRLVVEEPSGNRLVIPDSALPSIEPSDGTPLLKNAEHCVIVRIGAS